MAISKIIYKASVAATPETWMDSTPATAAAEDITAPKTAMLADGNLTEGTGTGGGNIGISQDQDGYLVLSAGEQPYVFYDWLQGDGNAFIDTGLDARVYGADTYERIIKFAWTSFAASHYPYIVGARNTDSGETGFYIGGEKNASNLNWYVSLCGGYRTYTATTRNDIIEVKTKDKKIYIDGDLVYTGTNNTPTINSAMNIPLFASAKAASGSGFPYDGYYITEPCPSKLYEFTVNDDNGDPVAHMVPAKRVSDDALGMYDTVRDVFYTNAAATGAFTIGND